MINSAHNTKKATYSETKGPIDIDTLCESNPWRITFQFCLLCRRQNCWFSCWWLKYRYVYCLSIIIHMMFFDTIKRFRFRFMLILVLGNILWNLHKKVSQRRWGHYDGMSISHVCFFIIYFLAVVFIVISYFKLNHILLKLLPKV